MLDFFNDETCKILAEQCQLISRLSEFINTPEQDLAHQTAMQSCNNAFNSICTASGYSSYCAVAIPLAVVGYQVWQCYRNRQRPRP